MCILCGDYVNLFECTFDFCDRELSIVSKFFINGMRVVTLAPAPNTMSGATIHPLAMMLLMSAWYPLVSLSRVSTTNLSLQYVNLTNCMENSGQGPMVVGG